MHGRARMDCASNENKKTQMRTKVLVHQGALLWVLGIPMIGKIVLVAQVPQDCMAVVWRFKGLSELKKLKRVPSWSCGRSDDDGALFTRVRTDASQCHDSHDSQGWMEGGGGGTRADCSVSASAASFTSTDAHDCCAPFE